jgi:hypothetical protein
MKRPKVGNVTQSSVYQRYEEFILTKLEVNHELG